MAMNPQGGSAILFLFVAVALFGALSYAFLQNSRGGTALVTAEANKASAVKSQDCANSLGMAIKRLNVRGCTAISYRPDGVNDLGGPSDGTCSVFHPHGGGAKACEGMILCPTAQLASLPIGGRCANIVYAGLSPDGSKRMYTTNADAGMFAYNNGNTSGYVVVAGATSPSTGEHNTEILATTDADGATAGFQPHQSAAYCYNLVVDGYDDWYLPAERELKNVVCQNAAAIGGFDMSGSYSVGVYKSSTDTGAAQPTSASVTWMNNCPASGGANSKPHIHKVRCVRKD